MITLLIFIFLILILFFSLFKFKKTNILFIVITCASFLIIGCGWLPSCLLRCLQSPFITLNPTWKNENAIVLLGAGTVKLPWDNHIEPTMVAYSRIMETARLYLSCKSSLNHCTIIITGGDATKTGKSEADLYQQNLISLGVNTTDIELENRSMNTYQNAEFTSNILQNKKPDQIILVTSALHMKRSLLYFNQFNITATPAPSDYLMPIMTKFPIGYNFAITDFAIHEYLGILRFRIYNYLGWNKKVTTAGAL